MPKRNVKASKARSAKRDDVPAELDFRKLEVVGFGLDSLDIYEARKLRTIVLDQDVAKVFHDGTAVNSVSRAFIEATGSTGKNRKRKSA